MSGRRRFSPKLLAAELDRQDLSNREFGRRVNPDRPEGGRTHLIAHLSGRHIPRRTTIEKYAEVLGVTYEALTVPEPERESVTRFQILRKRQDDRRVDQEAAA